MPVAAAIALAAALVVVLPTGFPCLEAGADEHGSPPEIDHALRPHNTVNLGATWRV